MAIYSAFEGDYAAFFSPVNVYPEGGVEIHNFVLTASMPEPEWELEVSEPDGTESDEALTGERSVYWSEAADFLDTPIFDQGLLKPGHQINGPAVIEAEYTPTVLDPGFQLAVDNNFNLVIQQT